MLTASRSRKPDRADIAIALALAGLGAVALVAPQIVLQLAPPCLVTLLLHQSCWGCGITRAALALLQGDVAGAWALNRASLLVLPMLLWLYGRHVRMIWRGFKRAGNETGCATSPPSLPR
ncbi:DUF2752 domain-containing protein [Massilia sp. TSP1-1-2]|uniref:DUF2752 domain-containing protein n=1 Tax=unclassified Massilia TaxID=2609279 RepID=UPI003CE95785